MGVEQAAVDIGEDWENIEMDHLESVLEGDSQGGVEDLLDKVMRSYLTNTNLINKRMVGVSIMMESKSAKSEQNRIWNNDACKSYEQNKDKMSPEDNNVSLKIYLCHEGIFVQTGSFSRGSTLTQRGGGCHQHGGVPGVHSGRHHHLHQGGGWAGGTGGLTQTVLRT